MSDTHFTAPTRLVEFGRDAFLGALRDEDGAISGDFVEVLWFQGLTEYLQPGHRAVS